MVTKSFFLPVPLLALFLSFYAVLQAQTVDQQIRNPHLTEQTNNGHFAQNQNQWDPEVEFAATIRNDHTVFLKQNAIVHTFLHGEDLHELHEVSHGTSSEQSAYRIRGHAVEIKFVGASTETIRGQNKSQTYHNYFKGKDQSKWAGNVPLFEALQYQNLYPGIHMNAYRSNKHFKYDLIVSPNTHPEVILLSYKGMESLKLSDGNLLITTSVGEYAAEVREEKPYAYQVIEGKKIEVRCDYVLEGNELSFSLPNGYNTDYELVIDPTLIAATHSGSVETIYGHTATYDDDGNIYLGGAGFSPGGLPLTPGSFQVSYGGSRDICLMKFDPTGSNLIWSTYLGGTDVDFPHSLFVSNNNELYVLGSSLSADYPTSNTAYDSILNNGGTGFNIDLVITKFNSAGTGIMGSTYVGGTSSDGNNVVFANYGDTYRGEIVVDGLGNCYVASMSSSVDFPTTVNAYQGNLAGGQDGVVFKLNSDLSSLLSSTYIGGANDDVAFGLREDGNGGIFVCGSIGDNSLGGTTGAAYPNFLGGNRDAYIAHLDSSGSTMIAATYFGSSDDEQAFFIDQDPSGDLFILGQTDGNNISATLGAYAGTDSGNYIAKFTPDLTNHSITSTFGYFSPSGFMVDNCGFIYAAGTWSCGYFRRFTYGDPNYPRRFLPHVS